ncbi:hypothetical protein [Candidatus Enterococcus clewellii]|uniref:HEAT repeat domain-containing protein n=1 Tax=Candidatus Enterococcus clewellii TaxID=1834193 RepID=A0A242K6Q2_9ENTE|nr:hypothetical protein [Enterococcus sp. 9E7_DIV0242]OTP15979.1 hypothetical protein A5888_002193 [Enterococcus sp. 9E7_DIV0242]
MEEKRVSVMEHFTQQMTSESQAELIKKCFYIIRNHKSERDQLFQVLENCLEGLTPKALLDTVKELRVFSYYKDKWGWGEWSQRKLAFSLRKKPAVFWLWLTAHPNGHIRELAWIKLEKVSTKFKLVFLLLTVNDNVPVLRQKAIYLLMNENQFSKKELIFSLPFIQRLGGLGHVESRAVQKYFIHLLLERPDILLEAQQSDDPFIYRYAFELSFLPDSRIIAESILHGLEKSDRVTLARTFRELVQTAEDKEEQIKSLLSHPQTVIRKLASSWCYNHLKREAAMIPLLLDSAMSIRYLARDYVSNHFPDVVIRSYYLEHVSSHEVTSIQGLAMLQDSRDSERMCARKNDLRKKIRVAVLTWLSCLPKEERLDYYIVALGDISRDVRKKAEIQLGELFPYFHVQLKQTLFERFKKSKEEKEQLSILNVLIHGTRKEYLFHLFDLYPDSINDTVQTEIKRRIILWEYEWNRRFFIAFTEEEQALLKEGEEQVQLFIFDNNEK